MFWQYLHMHSPNFSDVNDVSLGIYLTLYNTFSFLQWTFGFDSPIPHSISTAVYSLVFTFGYHLKRSNWILCLIHRVLSLSYLHLAQIVSFLGNSRSHTHTNFHHQVIPTQWRWVYIIYNRDTGNELATSRNQMSFSQHLYPVGQWKVVHIEIVYLKTGEIYLIIVL